MGGLFSFIFRPFLSEFEKELDWWYEEPPKQQSRGEIVRLNSAIGGISASKSNFNFSKLNDDTLQYLQKLEN